MLHLFFGGMHTPLPARWVLNQVISVLALFCKTTLILCTILKVFSSLCALSLPILHTWIRTYVHTYIHTYIRFFIIHTHIRRHIRTYMHAIFNHTHTHTCIHTCTCGTTTMQFLLRFSSMFAHITRCHMHVPTLTQRICTNDIACVIMCTNVIVCVIMCTNFIVCVIKHTAGWSI